MGKRKRKDGKNNPGAGETDDSSHPKPQRIPIGVVHLVHQQGIFVLIRSSRGSAIAPEAELLTYSQDGRPTGKLRLSQERKGAFLVADILQGQPGQGDRVLMFTYLDEKGATRSGFSDPAGIEVLE